MVQKYKGFRAKTRKKLAQKPRYRPAITKFLQEFDLGQKVVISIEPSSHSGLPHPIFKGKVGEVVGKRGRCYLVEVLDGKKLKKVIVAPEHLKPLK